MSDQSVEPKVRFVGGAEFNLALNGKSFIIRGEHGKPDETVTVLGAIAVEFANTTVMTEIFQDGNGDSFVFRGGQRLYQI